MSHVNLESEDSVSGGALSAADLAQLFSDVRVRIEAYPASGTSVFHDYWVAVFEDLRVEQCDVGLDAAIIGLASQVSNRVEILLSGPSEERRDHLPLLLRLWAADQDGSLGSLLQRSTVLVGWEYGA